MIYLIHFESPYYHAQHYIGYAADAEKRFKRHGTASGSNLLRAVKESGTPYKIVRTWEGGRQEERQLKRQKNAARFCPICAQKDFEKSQEKQTNRTRVIGRGTINLTPNPRYVQVPTVGEISKMPHAEGKPYVDLKTKKVYNRRRVIDQNKAVKKKRLGVLY